ncbi:H-NS histone family protein [Pontibaca salina]|uniref:H-NS histone family protein n=1 Tax=Pontibaca salina TaxID=2795731 RepID=A0A934HIC0_9RHOB|nr:H-NS histone family protein [Pontibaca salina]MBI6628699.1 H-NS histone family protein [Pontibaca salina]
MTLDLTAMSRKELLQLQIDVEKALKDAEKRDRREALKAAESAAAEYGYPLEDLVGGKKGSSARPKAAPKYRNPEKPEQTWTGRGRRPQWVHDALEKGTALTDLEI